MKLVQSEPYFSGFSLSLPSVYFVSSLLLFFRRFNVTRSKREPISFSVYFFFAGSKEHDSLHPLKVFFGGGGGGGAVRFKCIHL